MAQRLETDKVALLFGESYGIVYLRKDVNSVTHLVVPKLGDGYLVALSSRYTGVGFLAHLHSPPKILGVVDRAIDELAKFSVPGLVLETANFSGCQPQDLRLNRTELLEQTLTLLRIKGPIATRIMLSLQGDVPIRDLDHRISPFIYNPTTGISVFEIGQSMKITAPRHYPHSASLLGVPCAYRPSIIIPQALAEWHQRMDQLEALKLLEESDLPFDI